MGLGEFVRVLNYKIHAIPDGAVWIMRGKGDWGNPHRIRPGFGRKQVVDAFEATLRSQIRDPDFLARFEKLSRATALVCCCKPLRCYGDVLVDVMREFGLLARDTLF